MYNNFTYYNPTKVLFGAETEKEVGRLLKESSVKKVLLHYGGNSAKASGLLSLVETSLQENNIDYVSLGGVVANPHLSLVREGIALCKKEGVDFILAIGGGSVIDSAKAIAVGVCGEQDVWDYFTKSCPVKKALPVACVLTIAAAGSEMSEGSVITDEKTKAKRDCCSDLIRPAFAILNPHWTLSLPDYQTAAGITDMFTHILERYFNVQDNMEINDALCETLLRTIMKYGLLLKENPQDIKARSEIMWCGSLAHNGLLDCGVKSGDWGVHHIEHELSGLYDVTHGAGLAAIWPTWARYVWKRAPHRFVKFAENVMGVEGHSQEEIVENGIQALENFYHSIGMPCNLRELGIETSEEDILHMAKSCLESPCGYEFPLTEKEVAEIYRLAK